MDEISQKQAILDFLKHQKLGVLSTISLSRQPQAALLGFTETPDLEILFGTSKMSRKYKNLQHNPRVALVISEIGEKRITVQYEGVAHEVTSENRVRVQELHIAKNPHAAKFALDPNQTWFIISPSWVRYSDLGLVSEQVFEINFQRHE